jgi:hypothetical protein
MLVAIPVGIAGLLPYERSSLLGSSHSVSLGLLAPRSPPRQRVCPLTNSPDQPQVCIGHTRL